MKNTYLLLLCLSGLLMVTPGSAADFDKTLSANRSGEVRIDIVAGLVEVIGWDKPEVRVKGEVPDGDDKFVFKVSGDTTRIEAKQKKRYWGSSDSYTAIQVYCPENSSIKLEGVSTSFKVSNIKSASEVSTMSGHIKAMNIDGNFELETVSGDVTVDKAAGKLDLVSVSGDITANVIATYLDAKTVSGDIDTNAGSVDRVELESVSGDINASMLLTDDGRFEADTVSGDIDLIFQNAVINSSFDIETGPGGHVKNELSDHRADRKNRFSGSVEFELGEGSASVEIETMSGSVSLKR